MPAGGRLLVVGLGPAGPELTTPLARRAIEEAPIAFLRTARHPAAAPFVALANVVALDHCYEEGETFEEVYAAIVREVLDGVRVHGGATYAVPGSPAVAERTVELLREAGGGEVVVGGGMSFFELAWERLGIDPIALGVKLVDAEQFPVHSAGEAGPLLVSQCWSKAVMSAVKLAVDTEPSRPVVILRHLGLPDEQVIEVAWSEIDRAVEVDHLTSLYVPELAAPIGRETVRVAEVVRVLRERCPWDMDQTHSSLTRHLLEEAYEAVEAIDQLGDDPQSASPEAISLLEEELGDLLCQVLFHATLAEEEGLFNLADVARTLNDKLVSRHPHVFGDVVADTPDAVVANWERIKHSEKHRSHLFDGVPRAMPSLARAAKSERKLSSVGLGWDATGETAEELREMLEAVIGGGGPGALLVALARLSTAGGGDPEAAARGALVALGRVVESVEYAARDAMGSGGQEAAATDQAAAATGDGGAGDSGAGESGSGESGAGAPFGVDLGALEPSWRLEMWRAARKEL